MEYVMASHAVFKEKVLPKLQRLEETQTPTAIGDLNLSVTAYNVSIFEEFDRQLGLINFSHLALMLKVNVLTETWTAKVSDLLQTTLGVPLKQLVLSRLHLFRQYPENQRDFSGHISYFRMGWLLQCLNFESF